MAAIPWMLAGSGLMRVLHLLCLLSLLCCRAPCCRRLAEFLAYCLSYCFFTR